MNTPAARSAALRIVTNGEQAAGAIAWVERAGLTLNSFNSEGKFLHIMNELAAQRWQEAADHASQVTDADMTETPALYHTVGMACLMQAVPIELARASWRRFHSRLLHFRSPPIQRPSRSAGGRSTHLKRCLPSS